MEPALDVMSRALQGDPGGRSFLERTSSVYVLDVTDRSNPKTYGCWNFIHQAMNEVERFESKHAGQAPVLVSHVRLLSTMALRVARRSPEKDRALIRTCISNAAECTASASQLQWLIDLNLELREIVMGRIAAMAFDFSFHRMIGPQGHSSFADRVVMDTFCAILSANAVASGPQAIKHFATEWIIPSSRNLPSFAVASVVLHLALEGMRRSSPVGTKLTLQKLSNSVVVVVLAPTLADATSDNGDGELNSSLTPHEQSSKVATMCLRAIKAWCNATDLSLPQINHICTKENINIVSILSDAMYSDSDQVVDAVAELIEFTVHPDDEKAISKGRMNQVRLLLQVDEQSFRERFSAEQLKTIECRELAGIVDELVTAIGLQRFRFVERQNQDGHGVCRNLARIAASVVGTFVDAQTEGGSRSVETGALNLLLKAASHPATNICALVLPVLSKLVASTPSLTHELLPLLQRRAIIPHVFQEGTVIFATQDPCGASLSEYRTFRENPLSDALVECCKASSAHYMDSCALAVEEFCSENSSVEVSLQLEAALFCIEIVCPETTSSMTSFRAGAELLRVLFALSAKTPSLMMNALARARACRVLRVCLNEFISAVKVSMVSDIGLASFVGFLSNGNEIELSHDLLQTSPAPATDASLLLKDIMVSCAANFVDEGSIATLRDAWVKVVAASTTETKNLPFDSRLIFGTGYVHVLKILPEKQCFDLFSEMAANSLSRLEEGREYLDNEHNPERKDSVLCLLGQEIMLLSGLVQAFADEKAQRASGMQSGTTTSPDRRHCVAVPSQIIAVALKAFPGILYVASHHLIHKSISVALTTLFDRLIPITQNSRDPDLLRSLCSVMESALQHGRKGGVCFDLATTFIFAFVDTYGHVVEDAAQAKVTGSGSVSPHADNMGRILEEMIVEILSAAKGSLGRTWEKQIEQGQGEAPFESRAYIPSTNSDSSSTDALSAILRMLAKCVEHSPLFILYVLPGTESHQSYDSLLHRAADSAAAYLNDEDVDICRGSLAFLRALTSQRSRHTVFEAFVNQSLTRIRGIVINNSLAASCGQCDSSMLHDVASLLMSLLSTSTLDDVETQVITSLRKDHFSLGDPAKNVTLSVFRQCQQRQISISQLEEFLDALWDIHQTDDTDSLPTSDIVADFISKYTSTTTESLEDMMHH